MTYQQYLKKRKAILANSTGHRIFNNHSANVKNTRVCALCGRLLTTYVPRLNAFQVIRKHYHYFYYEGRFSGSVCYNAKDCYQHVEGK